MEPFVLCFTGISGSGKTTLANGLSEALAEGAMPFQVIDGDVLRNELGNLFGYTREERMKQNQVVRILSKYLLQNGVSVVISVVAPYDEMRKKMRSFFGRNFFLVYAKCPFETCEKRDVKGYYQLSRENRMRFLNGADDVYEVPEDAELVVDTGTDSAESCVRQILLFLRGRGYAV